MVGTIDNRTATSVSGVLEAVHERWMEQITAFLSPALSEDADFWTRWSGVRFLDDQFAARFRLECALLESLAPLLSAETNATITAARKDLERTLEQLIDAGRRHETAVLTARLARQFIDKFALWCIEVELATGRVEIEDLPLAASRLLTRLRLSTLWH